MNRTTKLGTLLVVLLAAGCSNTSKSQDDATGDSGAGAVDADVDAGDDAASGDDGAPTGCAYPPGPYGVAVGKVLNPDLQWQGFAPNASAPSTVKITDLYDCDGSKGINAIVVDSAGQWCVACQAIVQQVPIWLSSSGDKWTKLGVQILNLVIQNNDYEPATITTAQQWRDQYKLTSIYVVADPNDTFPTNELPYELLVDPRTMKVVHNLTTDTNQAADGSDPNVTQLATKNAAGPADGG